MKAKISKSGVSWAEALLARQGVSQMKIRRMLRVGIVALCLATVPVAEGATASACGKTVGEALYVASFKWNGGMAQSKDLKVVIAKAAKPGFSGTKILAKIMSSNTCEAVCAVQKLETMGAGKTVQVASLEMSCKSAAFGALAAPATLFFRDGITGRRASALRFGTWLQGYEQAVLTTELDRSARLIREMTRPAPEPVKLAGTP